MLAANLAAAMAQNRRVCLVDIDPQRSLSRWHEIRSGQKKPLAAISLSNVSGWRLRAELDRLMASHDALIVDTPPQVETDAKLAIRAAHLVLVPLQPSPPDFWAAGATVQLAQAERRPLRLVLNRAPATSTLRSFVEREVKASGQEMLNTAIGNRAGFANAFAQGLGITEAGPKTRAAAELLAVLAEIEELTA
jgi:chromosome partitioning protein